MPSFIQRAVEGRSMKVLHVYSGNLFGGIERFLVTLQEERLRCPEMEPSFALCFEGELASRLRDAGAQVRMLGEVRARRPWTLARARAALRSLLRSERPDWVMTHASWPHGLFGSVPRHEGIPVAFFLHDVVKGNHWTEKLAATCPPDLLLSNSHFTAEARHIFIRQPAKVIYHPIKCARMVKSRNEVRQDLSTPEDAIVITQVSRMEHWKGHRLLIRALEQLNHLPGWMCWIAGGVQRESEEKYWLELHQLVRETGIESRVRFLGHRGDIPDVLGASDIFCQPNEMPEPFGIVFIEALYAGLPVVSTKLGGAEELLADGGGFLVPKGDYQALARTLQTLILNDEMRMNVAASGPPLAAKLCDPTRQLRRLWSCLCSVTTELTLRSSFQPR